MARAGERTKLLIGDGPVPQVRFRATTLEGAPGGQIFVETVDGTQSLDLGRENLVDTGGLISLSVVARSDTAITFVPVQRPSNPLFLAAGLVFVIGAVAWTARDVLGL